MLGHKISLTKIISNIFSDHSGMKLEISNRKKIGKLTNMWKLNTLSIMVKKKSSGKLKKKISWDKWKWKHNIQKLRNTAKTVMREVYRNKCLH